MTGKVRSRHARNCPIKNGSAGTILKHGFMESVSGTHAETPAHHFKATEANIQPGRLWPRASPCGETSARLRYPESHNCHGSDWINGPDIKLPKSASPTRVARWKAFAAFRDINRSPKITSTNDCTAEIAARSAGSHLGIWIIEACRRRRTRSLQTSRVVNEATTF